MYHTGGAIELTLTGVDNSSNTTANCDDSNSGSGGLNFEPYSQAFFGQKLEVGKAGRNAK